MVVKSRVFDKWWPWRTGVVIKVCKTRLHVRWLDNGEIWKYDKAHMKFLCNL